MSVASRFARNIFMLAACCLVAACDRGGNAAGERPPPPVVVEEIQQQDFPLIAELPGRILAIRVAEVRPQVGGILQKRLFEEGSLVNQGDQLYQIEAAQYKAAVASARAKVAQQEAVLTKARLREKRLARLINTKAVSQEDYDLAAAELREAEAGVAAAQAALRSASIDLGYTQIVAPISGRIGKSLITEGALVEAEQENELAVIQKIDQVYVDITQSTTELLRLKNELASGRVRRAPGAMALTVILDDGSVYGERGELKFSEISVDQGTSSVTLRGVVPNPDHLLLPGMFVRVKVDQGVRENSVLAPQRGVTFDYSGNATALVVGADNVVQRRELELGQAYRDQWLVLSGLEPGDRVIVEGLQKIRNGMPVKPTSAASKEEKPAEA